jgi:hypothetical protein
MRIRLTFALLLMLGATALAADSPAPKEFGDVPLGASLQELKSRYPDASRNPDSDRHFQVYQVPTLHGASVKSPGAFQIYQGRVVGGQILLDSHNAQHWFDATVARYGKPDSCTYCDDPESTTAFWHWENGTSLKIEGEMLTELTHDGASGRSAWLARGDNDELADNGDETTDEGGVASVPAPPPPKHRRKVASHEGTTAALPSRQDRSTAWRSYYKDMNSRLEHWLGLSK